MVMRVSYCMLFGVSNNNIINLLLVVVVCRLLLTSIAVAKTYNT